MVGRLRAQSPNNVTNPKRLDSPAARARVRSQSGWSGHSRVPRTKLLDWLINGLIACQGPHLQNSEECDPGRKKSETNPSNHRLPLHRQDNSRNNLNGLKPTEDFFFSLSSFPPEFLLPFFFFSVLLPPIRYLFYVFFLPSFIYFYVLIFVKIPSYLDSDLSLFLLPFFLPFLLFYFLFPSFTSSFFFLSSPLSLFPTSETTKPGVLKRLELDCVKPINVSSRPVSTGD